MEEATPSPPSQVSDIVPASSANLEGVFVGSLSPVKTSRNSSTKYFSTQFSDGNQTIHFVSFEPKLWSQINDATANSTTVSLRNCSVKRGRQNDLEVFANSHTSIVNSPKKINVDQISILEHNSKCVRMLDDLKDIAEHQNITVSGKIMTMFPIKSITIKATGNQLKRWISYWLIKQQSTDVSHGNHILNYCSKTAPIPLLMLY